MTNPKDTTFIFIGINNPPIMFREGVNWGVTLAQLVKASVGQADVQRFEPHLGHN